MYVKGHFTEDRAEWQKKKLKGIAKRCTPICKKQKKSKKKELNIFSKRDQQFTEDGCNAEITVDLVLQARTKLSDNKVNGPEDAIVSEMIKKKLPM